MTQRKVALVTGGAKRVGRAIVEKFAGSGFDVAFTYLTSESDADDVVAKTSASTGRKIAKIRADLTQPATAIDPIVEAVQNEFGRLDVLINNASLYKSVTLQQTDIKLMQQVAAIHAQSPLLLCQKFETYLRSSRGHVINMVDLLAEKPWPQYLIYCASKAALWNLTLGLAKELAPDVTVNGIAPGVVDWPADYPEAEQQKYLNRVPLGRAGTPQDVAETAYFLVTAGSYITGQIIRLDGGRSIT